MKTSLKKETILRLCVGICFLALFAWAIAWANSGWPRDEITDSTGVEYETGRVLEILEDRTVADEAIEGRLPGSRVMLVEILTGRYEGEVARVTNYFSAMYSVDVAVELVRGVAGSMGIILTVPCVAAITAWLLTRKNDKRAAALCRSPQTVEKVN